MSLSCLSLTLKQQVLDATSNGTPSLLVRGSGQASDLIADCVLARYSPDHPLGVKISKRDTKQTLLMRFFTVCCGLRTDEGVDGEEDINDDLGSHSHLCYNLFGVRFVFCLIPSVSYLLSHILHLVSCM
jgi:hypothetical protein